jgi:hypothetical protein
LDSDFLDSIAVFGKGHCNKPRIRIHTSRVLI